MVTGKYVSWGGRLAVTLGLLSTSLLPIQAVADSDSLFSCADAIDQPASSTNHSWLVRSLGAGHCYDFQARAVSIDALGVRTLALSQRIRDGVRQQVVQHLDGPSVSVERRSIAGQLGLFSIKEDGKKATPEAWARHVAEYYDVSLHENARVAGRDAVKLRFSPKDQQRYQHVWWVDKETGLLLKHVLSDTQNHVLETFQITQLHSPIPYEGIVAGNATAEYMPQEWKPSWLPDGFIAQPLVPGQREEGQRVYSDGLATVSLFVTPQGPQDLKAGVHRLGVSTAAVAYLTTDEQRWQLVGIGELPPKQLQRIVQSVNLE